MTAPAPEPDLHLHDYANAYIAGTQIFNYGDSGDLIEMTPVPGTDLEACAAGRFVTPGGEWATAAGKLGEHGSLIITGDRGTGRRTAALWLLSHANKGGRIYELTPQWKNRPSLQAFRPLARPGTWYLMDMSDEIEDPPAPPAANFGKKLMDWAREHGLRMIVIAANDTGAQSWAGSAGGAQVRLTSPDARELAVQELQAAGIQDHGIIDDEAFTAIWKSKPRAEGACRLARLIAERGKRSLQEIADEYRGWREWLSTEVPDGIGARTLLWSAAFCNGGQRRSVVRMSEQLRRKLGDPRPPQAILSDAPVSARLDAAKLEPKEDATVSLPESKHGLDAALRAYLWDEFEDPELRGFLTQWLIELLAELPVEDAERVARGVLDIVVRFRDEELLKGLRDNFSDETKRPIAVQTLASAALDPQFGAHVRARLYTWARTSKSQADLVADVCGSTFGERMPGAALVRLGWAAQNSRPDSLALARALAAIAGKHPEAARTSIEKWFSDYDPPTAGLNAFLALASTRHGAQLLSGWADPDSGKDGYRDRLVSHLQLALAPASDTYEAAISVLQTWETLVSSGVLDSRNTVNLLGKALQPEFGNTLITRLYPGTWDMNSFWGQVFTVALTGNEIGRAETPGDKPDDSASSPETPGGDEHRQHAALADQAGDAPAAPSTSDPWGPGPAADGHAPGAQDGVDDDSNARSGTAPGDETVVGEGNSTTARNMETEISAEAATGSLTAEGPAGEGRLGSTAVAADTMAELWGAERTTAPPNETGNSAAARPVAPQSGWGEADPGAQAD